MKKTRIVKRDSHGVIVSCPEYKGLFFWHPIYGYEKYSDAWTCRFLVSACAFQAIDKFIENNYRQPTIPIIKYPEIQQWN